MFLNQKIDKVVIKSLTTTELPDLSSNQHELNGIHSLREFFGTDQDTAGKITWVQTDPNGDVIVEEGDFRFYDARANNPKRTEWRMYYSGNFLNSASPGDLLVIIKSHGEEYYSTLVENRSSSILVILTLMGFNLNQQDIQGLIKFE